MSLSRREGRARKPRVVYGERQERIVLGLEAEGAVITGALEGGKVRARIAGILERCGGVDTKPAHERRPGGGKHATTTRTPVRGWGNSRRVACSR